MASLYTWKVCPAPTGRYKSFEHRGWPMAYYNNSDESPAAQIICSDSYTPKRVRDGVHAPLKVMVADHSLPKWQWRKSRGEFKTLDEAKIWVHDILKKCPHFVPGYKPPHSVTETTNES